MLVVLLGLECRIVSPAHPNPLQGHGLPVSKSLRKADDAVHRSRADPYELLASGRKEAALAAFEKADAINPQNASHLIQLARLVSEVGESSRLTRFIASRDPLIP